MSSSDYLAPRPVIHRLVLEHAGPSPDATAFAGAGVQVFEQAARQLLPLIGERGVNALAARSLRLIQGEFPWLTATEEPVPELSPLAQVHLDLKAQPPAVALAAAVSLLVTFTDLLSTFVGASLTMSILGQAWHGDPDEGAVEGT
jgi:hypothetical protein